LNLAIDIYYHDKGATCVGVLFEWGDAEPQKVYIWRMKLTKVFIQTFSLIILSSSCNAQTVVTYEDYVGQEYTLDYIKESVVKIDNRNLFLYPDGKYAPFFIYKTYRKVKKVKKVEVINRVSNSIEYVYYYLNKGEDKLAILEYYLENRPTLDSVYSANSDVPTPGMVSGMKSIPVFFISEEVVENGFTKRDIEKYHANDRFKRWDKAVSTQTYTVDKFGRKYAEEMVFTLDSKLVDGIRKYIFLEDNFLLGTLDVSKGHITCHFNVPPSIEYLLLEDTTFTLTYDEFITNPKILKLFGSLELVKSYASYSSIGNGLIDKLPKMDNVIYNTSILNLFSSSSKYVRIDSLNLGNKKEYYYFNEDDDTTFSKVVVREQKRAEGSFKINVQSLVQEINNHNTSRNIEVPFYSRRGVLYTSGYFSANAGDSIYTYYETSSIDSNTTKYHIETIKSDKFYGRSPNRVILATANIYSNYSEDIISSIRTNKGDCSVGYSAELISKYNGYVPEIFFGGLPYCKENRGKDLSSNNLLPIIEAFIISK
jgi:hypothetical protein